MTRVTTGLCVTALMLVTLPGCGGGSGGAPTGSAAGEAADAELEVLSPEEAQAEAERSITAENADEAFSELKAEIEADLGDGG